MQLEEGLARLGIAERIDAKRQEALLAYLALLYKWNRTYALTALSEDKGLSYHLLDSLAVLPYVDVEGATLLDVGSGGGMPGLPLAITLPALQVTLIDSNSKKTAFLQQAVIELGLKNVQVIHARVEAYQPPTLFTAIISRAFAEIAEFTGMTAHLLAPSGVWLAMKGKHLADEIGRLSPEIKVKSSFSLTIPGVDEERHLVMLCRAAAEGVLQSGG